MKKNIRTVRDAKAVQELTANRAKAIKESQDLLEQLMRHEESKPAMIDAVKKRSVQLKRELKKANAESAKLTKKLAKALKGDR